jgi:hypothetical protein
VEHGVVSGAQADWTVLAVHRPRCGDVRLQISDPDGLVRCDVALPIQVAARVASRTDQAVGAASLPEALAAERAA